MISLLYSLVSKAGLKTSEIKKWDLNYESKYYSEVLDVTGCPKVRTILLRPIEKEMKTILIPGCGSRTYLAEAIVENCPWVEKIYCSDISEMAIKLARDSFTHEKLVYQVKDTRYLDPKEGLFDAIIVVNSIISEDGILNRNMLSGCHRVLRKDGLFLGLFPDIMCSVELCGISPKIAKMMKKNINIRNSTVYESAQKMRQIFYSPLRLRHILSSVGFNLDFEDIQRVAFDSPYFQSEYKRLYGWDDARDWNDPELFIYENFVCLQKAE